VIVVVLETFISRRQMAEMVSLSENCVTDLDNLLVDFENADRAQLAGRLREIKQAYKKVLVESA
jgi:hypothetical protein